MNHCILMAEIVQDPQLRYTPDQTPVAEMLVQFPALKAEDPPSTLKVVGWGNLAQSIQEGYHTGDRIIIEGRLGMNNIDRPEGFKEKRAELTVQRIHRLDAGAVLTSYATMPAAGMSNPPVNPSYSAPAASPMANPMMASANPGVAPLPRPQSAAPMPPQTASIPTPAPDYDDIPF